jgi:signal transduction histidine kinase
VMEGPDQRYTLVSPAYETFAGQSPLAGRAFLEVFPHLRDSVFDRAHRRVFLRGEPVTLRESPVAIDRDGDGVPEPYLFDTYHAPLRDADGAVYAVATVAVDVTMQVQARLEVEQARAEAEAASRAKGDFLAVMSHELRTPLNAIGGYAELLEMGIHGPITDDQRTDLRRIQHSQRHLLGLINELLNFTKLQAGSVVFDIADVEVIEALESAEALVVPQARARRLALTIEPEMRGLSVRADEEKLRQLLVNLLSNAVKFTEPGGAITAGAAADGDRVRLFVRDTGIGIAPDQLDRIFEPFTQVCADHTRTADGTGLGLAISRDLARGMGGELTVESTLGEGSCFVVLLPAAHLPRDGIGLA